MDNELPEVLKVGNEYNIPKMVYHRLHKGEGRLIIDIKEYEEENDKIQKDNGRSNR